MNAVRIIVWSINYAPEETGIAPCNVALCEFLKTQGHDVEMVSTFSYYPAWKKRPEDRGKLYRTDVTNGVPVHRCWHYVPHRATAFRRIVHEATFVLTSFLRLITLPRADVMVVVSPPLLLGTAAALMGWLKRSPYLFHVQDLQPDAAIGLGMLKEGAISRALYGLEALAYRCAAMVSGITRGMLEAFTAKGVPRERQAYLPNPVQLPRSSVQSAGQFRSDLNIPGDALLAVYSGNLGVKQGLAVLLEAAPLCAEWGVQIVICGDGAERETLSRCVREHALANVHLLPLQPRDRYQQMLADSDLCLVTQQKGTGRLFFPSKVLTTLAHAKPVLAVADRESDLAVAVEEGQCGYCVATEDAEAVANALLKAVSERAALPEMGRRGREWVSQFEAGLALGRFEEVLRAIVCEHDRRK